MSCKREQPKKTPNQDQPTSEPDMKVGHGSGDSHSDGDGYREECDVYEQKMREKKGCRTNTAPRGPKHTTSSDNCDNQPPDIKKARPLDHKDGLVATSRIDADDGATNARANDNTPLIKNAKRCRRTKGAEQKQPRQSKPLS